MSARAVLLAAVRFYQRAISPNLAPRCRFVPTCSEYAVEAVEVHGAARGSWLAVRRLLKCAPWHRGGVDLVPPPRYRTTGGSRSGTAEAVHTWNTGAPPSAVAHPDLVHVPAPGRTPHQEAGVA
jgi:putative membrane protein insertion efficiency factor